MHAWTWLPKSHVLSTLIRILEEKYLHIASRDLTKFSLMRSLSIFKGLLGLAPGQSKKGDEPNLEGVLEHVR